MQQLWHGLWWIGSKLLFLASLMVGTLMIVMLPLMLASGAAGTGPVGLDILGRLQFGPWWREVSFHLTHIAHGHLLPPNPPPQLAQMWQALPREISTALPITLKLVGFAFIESLVLGLLGGCLMSRLAPNWLRKPAWATSTVLQCMPDLLIACTLDLALIMLGQSLGKSWAAPEMKIWQQLLAPTLAMTMLAAPYIARVTATAIDEVRGELFIRTAMAKGLPAWRVVVKHIGKSVLLRTWTVLPVVTSILLSAAAVVEYIMEIHGIGRNLVLSLGPLAFQWYPDRYAAVVFLWPLVALFTLISALSQVTYQLMDPRPHTVAQPARRPITGAGWRRIRMPSVSFPTLASVSLGLRESISAIPDRLSAAARALKEPPVLTGTLLLVGLIVVAVGSPWLAPYPPDQQIKIHQDASGHIWVPPLEPAWDHLLGTDQFGRDTFSRLIYATRYGLMFAALAMPARFLLGLLFGVAAAWRGGIWNRLIDWFGLFFTAVPQVVVPLAMIPVFNGLSAGDTQRAVAWGVFWVAVPGVARLASSIRDQTLSALALPFLAGAEAVGAGSSRVIARYILPHMTSQLLTMAVLEMPAVMTLTATLAFFYVSPGGWMPDASVGAVPVVPEWGSMLDKPLLLVMAPRWWRWAPMAALFVALLAFNLIGEGLRRRWAGGELQKYT